METIFKAVLPIKLISEANNFDHWTKKKKRKDAQKILIDAEMKSKVIPLPCTIKLTRVAPRALDSDNLQGAFKHVRDYVSNNLLPGQRIGRADNSPYLFWEYAQEKGLPKEYKVIIDISI